MAKTLLSYLVGSVLKEVEFYKCSMGEIVLYEHTLTKYQREGVMNREAWHAAVCGVAKSWTWHSN